MESNFQLSPKQLYVCFAASRVKTRPLSSTQLNRTRKKRYIREIVKKTIKIILKLHFRFSGVSTYKIIIIYLKNCTHWIFDQLHVCARHLVRWVSTVLPPNLLVEESCAKKGGYLEQIDTFIFSNEFCWVGCFHVSYKTRP